MVIMIVIAVWLLPLCYTFLLPRGQRHQNKLQTHQNSLPEHISTTLASNIVVEEMPSQYGYVVGLSYSGQQGAGIQALTSLQCFIGSFNLPMRILEPLIGSTKFESYHSLGDLSSSVSFSDMFDIVHFNHISERAGLASLAPIEEFTKDAPKTGILVVVKRESSNSQNSNVNLIWSSPNNMSMCYQLNEHMYSMNVMSTLKSFIDTGFCIKRVVVLDVSQKNGHSNAIFTEIELYNSVFGHFPPRSITLIFSEWRTPWYVTNSRLKNPTECHNMKEKSKKAQFRPSPKLLSDVEYYKDHYLNSSNSLAIMLRVERMLLKLRQRNDVEKQVKLCLNEVTRIASHLWQEKRQPGIPLVTLDLGKYGSSSWSSSLAINRKIDLNKVTKLAKETLYTLFDNKWSFEQWEMSFTEAVRGLENDGYIAALQRTLASQAECLVLVGGGNFQELAMRDYMRNHPDKGSWCIHLVCAVNEERLTSEIRQSLTTLRFDSI